MIVDGRPHRVAPTDDLAVSALWGGWFEGFVTGAPRRSPTGCGGIPWSVQPGDVGAGWSLTAAIEDAIARRAAAKKAKNFAEADAIRAELLAKGIVLTDSPTGTTWTRK